MKTFEAFLLECGKGDKGYDKKEKCCDKCGKECEDCECDECQCEESDEKEE